MALIERYLLRQLLPPFLLGVFVVTFLLTMDFLLDYLDLFLGKGIDLFTVSKLFGLGLGWMLSLSVPCGVLVGTLMTYGRLAQDSEVVALKASGISPFRVIRPALAASVILSIALVGFHNYVLPDMNHAFAGLMLAVNKTRPTAEIQEGVFIELAHHKIWIGNLDDKSGEMRDVLIYDASRKNEPPRTIRADHGRLEFDGERGVLSMHLSDGEIHEAGKKMALTYRKMDFQHQILNLLDTQQTALQVQKRRRGQREMNIAAMKGEIAKLAADGARYREKGERVLGELGLDQVGQLPGMEPEPGFLERALALVGAGPEHPDAPPDTFWTRERKRKAEDAKLAVLQAKAAAKKINQYRVEIHKKFSIPFACVVFALVGAPLGIRARRGGLTAGFLSVGFFVFYYLCLVGGEQLADRQHLAPWLSMWLPNIILGALGTWLALYVCQALPQRRRRGVAAC